MLTLRRAVLISAAVASSGSGILAGCVLAEYSASAVGAGTTILEDAGTGTGSEGGVTTNEAGASEGGTTTDEGGTSPQDAGVDAAMPFDAGPPTDCGSFGSPIGGFCADFEAETETTAGWSVQQEGGSSISKGAGRTGGGGLLVKDTGGAGSGSYLSRGVLIVEPTASLTFDFVVDATFDGAEVMSLVFGNNSYELVVDPVPSSTALIAIAGGKASKKLTTRSLTSGWHAVRFELNPSTGIATATLDGTNFLPAGTLFDPSGSSGSGTLKIGAFPPATGASRATFSTVRFDNVVLTPASKM